jgi:hypothetical protein
MNQHAKPYSAVARSTLFKFVSSLKDKNGS